MSKTLSALVAMTAALCGCYAVTDLDRFQSDEQGQASQSNAFRDLRLTLRNMKPHAAHLFEYRVVNEANLVISAGKLQELGAYPLNDQDKGPPVVIYVANAVPRQGTYRLDFYADVNHSGSFDGIGDIKTRDHAWRINSLNEPDPSFGQIVDDKIIDLTYTHDANLTDIDTLDGAYQPPVRPGADATVRLTNMAAFAGKLVEARIVQHATGQVVGLYRIPKMNSSDAVCLLPGLVESGVDYDIEVYADANGDQAYEPTGDASGDGGWRLTVTAADPGIDVTVDPASSPAQVGVLFTY